MFRPLLFVLLLAATSHTAAHSQTPIAPTVPAVSTYVQRLRSSDAIARSKAAKALGEMKDAARPAVPDLVRALADHDPFVARDAAEALGKIGDCAVPSLVQ